jgi:hypothetical protein
VPIARGVQPLRRQIKDLPAQFFDAINLIWSIRTILILIARHSIRGDLNRSVE